jgi:hypothetical protein
VHSRAPADDNVQRSAKAANINFMLEFPVDLVGPRMKDGPVELGNACLVLSFPISAILPGCQCGWATFT